MRREAAQHHHGERRRHHARMAAPPGDQRGEHGGSRHRDLGHHRHHARGHAGIAARSRLGLRQEGQHRAIGRLEQHDRDRQQDDARRLHQRAQGGALVGLAAARRAVVDRRRLDQPDDGARQDGRDHDGERDEPEAEGVAEHGREQRVGGVAGVVERLVARHAFAIAFGPDEAERDRRDERCDGGVGDADQQLRRTDHPDAVRRHHRHRPDRDAEDGEHQPEALGRDAVDEGADRRGREQAGEAGERHGDARGGGIEPFLLQVDAEEGTEALARAGQGEVHGIECRADLQTNTSLIALAAVIFGRMGQADQRSNDPGMRLGMSHIVARDLWFALDH